MMLEGVGTQGSDAERHCFAKEMEMRNYYHRVLRNVMNEFEAYWHQTPEKVASNLKNTHECTYVL